MRSLARTLLYLIVATTAARVVWHRRIRLAALVRSVRDDGRIPGAVPVSTAPPQRAYAAPFTSPTVSGPGEPVDHERQHGVPPDTNDDYVDDRDLVGAASFPASDPPAGW